MKFKKLIALLLCAVMLMCTLASCKTTVDDVIDDYTEEETSTRDYEAARTTYGADEIVMTIDNEDITWDEFFDWICYALSNYEYSYGQVSDFNVATANGNMSATIVKEAEEMITMYRSVEKKAAELGVKVADDVDDQIAEYLADALESFENDEEAFNDFINQYYGSMEMYEYVTKINSLSPDLFAHYFGENGEKLTDEQIAKGSEGYLMAKHILIQTTDPETGLVLDNEAMKAAQEKIESIYAQLTAYEGDDLEGYFDELTAQYTEDDGYLTYPDGYLFQQGDMVNEFYNAALSVEEGQFSEIVESQYGYHIVMRLPIDLDATPIGLLNYGYTESLRFFIAQQYFSEESNSWTENVDVVTTDNYAKIDLAQVFPMED